MATVIQDGNFFTTKNEYFRCGITRASVKKVLYGRTMEGRLDCCCGELDCYSYARRKDGSIRVGCREFSAAEVRRVKRLVPRTKKSSIK